MKKPFRELQRQTKINRHLDHLEICGLRMIGRSSYRQAFPPLPVHFHEGIAELCFIERGTQSYLCGDRKYLLSAGDCFLTAPGTIHRSASPAQEPGIIHFLWLDLQAKGRLLGLPEQHDTALRAFLTERKERLINPVIDLKRPFDQLLIHTRSNDLFSIIGIHEAVFSILSAFGAEEIADRQISEEIRSSMEYIQKNLSGHISVAVVAERTGLSSSRFKERFRSETGMAPVQFQRRCRLIRAKTLLTAGEKSITHIAMELGFSSGQHFATVFHHQTGLTPSQWRSPDPEDPVGDSSPVNIDYLEEI